MEKEFTKAGSLDTFEELLGNNLIRIDVWSIKDGAKARMNSKAIHNVGAGLVPARIARSAITKTRNTERAGTSPAPTTYTSTLARRQNVRR